MNMQKHTRNMHYQIWLKNNAFLLCIFQKQICILDPNGCPLSRTHNDTPLAYAPDWAETMPPEEVEPTEPPVVAPAATEQAIEVDEPPPPPMPQDTQEFGDDQAVQEVEGKPPKARGGK